MNLFDNLQKDAFAIVTNTFGYNAAWQPSDLSDRQTAEVLLSEPTKESQLGGIEYSPTTYIAEYFNQYFKELKAAVDAGQSEKLTINENDYYVRKVDALADGKTFRAILEKIT